MSDAAILQLRDLEATDLRCHRRVRWRCEPGMNLVTGANGSGKTSLLEAVHLMGHGRSFRQARDPALARWESDGFRISGTWRRYGPLHVRVTGGGRGTEVFLQGRRLTQRMELAETLPVLVESPQGARLVDGAPAERRRWLDRMTLYCRPEVAPRYRAYLRCLMQRGRLLRRRASEAEIEVWEQQMAAHGVAVMRARDEVMAALNAALAEETELTGSGLRVRIRRTAPMEAEAFAARLARQRREARGGPLRMGPHCDRVEMPQGPRDIRACGSRGQQKLAAAAVRLAECAVRGQHRGLVPVLLLDDCMEALDPSRRRALLARLARHEGQVLMTAPTGAILPGNWPVHTFALDAGGQEQPARAGVEEAA